MLVALFSSVLINMFHWRNIVIDVWDQYMNFCTTHIYGTFWMKEVDYKALLCKEIDYFLESGMIFEFILALSGYSIQEVVAYQLILQTSIGLLYCRQV